jgi:hypothetical protein
MGSQDDRAPHQKGPESRDTSLKLILSMADTTWRMFTPPAIFVPVAIYGDLKLGTKPWLTLLSVPFSLWLSVLLVKRQLSEGE